MKNVKEIKIEVKGKEWQDALDKAFTKKKKDIKVDGFRKGACPKDVYIKKVGIEALCMDACDIAIEDAYKKAFDDADMEIVCEPNVNIESVTKEAAVFVFTMIGRPEITLGDYKKLGVKKEKVKVTDEEIEHEIEHIKEHMAEIVNKKDGTVVEGNTAVIDFDGVVDGKPLDGGSGKNYSLEIGSNTFIPGFEEQLIGMKPEEEKEIEVTFPEDYNAEDLKGAKATFKVKVNEVKEKVAREMDEEFFEDLGMEGINSEESLRKEIEESIKAGKEADAENNYIDKLLEEISKNVEVDIPEEMVDEETERLLKRFEQQLQMQGVSLDIYYQFTQTNEDSLKEQLEKEAYQNVLYRLMLEEIMNMEKIEVTESDAEKEAEEIAKKYQMEKEELLDQFGGLDMIQYDLEMRRTIEKLKELNK